MAFWGRAHVIKAALLAGILLVLLNFYNYRLDNKIASTFSMVHVSTPPQWPKRTRTSSELAYFTQSAPSNGTSMSKAKQNFQYSKTYRISKNNTSSTHIHLNATKSNRKGNITVVNSNSKVILDNRIVELNNNSAEVGGTVATDTDRLVELPANESVVPTIDDQSTTSHFLQSVMKKLGLNTCPPIPPNLDGPIEVNTTLDTLKNIEARYAAKLLPGGWFKPTECTARDRVAIVIPYRDRATHLPIFLANLHPFLMKQQIEYGIFLIEQVADGLFNRAALMNVGFVEALKLSDWDCFIFHDIDLLPMDDRNLYTCPDQPRHMSVAVDTMGFKLPYSSIFGGVSALTVKQFKTVNGFSNSFWGWGGEDDDMSNRLKHVGFHIARYPVNIARYTMLSHKKEKANPKRYENLVNGAKKFDVEGLNSLKYKIQYLEKKILYTWVVVEIKQDSHRKATSQHKLVPLATSKKKRGRHEAIQWIFGRRIADTLSKNYNRHQSKL